MNKLISRNPVLRFKLGRKIEKFLGGGFSRKSSGRTSNEQAAYIFKKIFSPEKWFSIKPTGGGLLGWINRTPTVDTVTKQNTVSTPKDYSFMTKGTLAPESELSKKEREDYFNKLKLKYNLVSTPSKKLTNIPVNNIWLKGYKHDEVKDVKAMLNELIKLGLLNDRFGADGKWGDNTEEAYLKYLSIKNIPVYEKPETSSVAAMTGIYSEENKPLYQRIRFKQGGQLPSRNIIERFKQRSGSVTTLKTGGSIPKLQTAWLPINWNDNNKFVDLVVSNVANEVKKAKKVVENQRKANNVANRKTKVPGIDNTAKLQLALYDNGFFKGVIDKKRTGKQVTLERAVDGYMGDMTNLAIQNAKKAGYIVNANTGEIKLPKKRELAYGKTPQLSQQLQQAGTFSFENAKNKGKELLSRIFGDKDIITGRNEQLEKVYLLRYNTPYSLDIDKGEPMMKTYVGPDGFISYQLVEGPDGRPVYTSKAGNLGLFNRQVGGDGRVYYQIKNDKGEIVTRCSETANLINRTLGLPTTGDAWTRHGVYGDSLIYGGINHNRVYTRPVGKIINGLRPDLLDPNNLKTGDFVDLYTEGSGHNSEAVLGRGNSHTGTIYKPSGDNGPVYIIHGGLNKKVYVDPLDRFGPLSTWSIMGIRRPGSKEHPYYKEDI